MNKAISARIRGDDYQALFFWSHAIKLFHNHTSVEKVIYEAENIKSFDDVVVVYKKEKPIIDCRDNKIYMDCYQVKFHVTQNGAFKWEELKNPKFINATSVSIMQRLVYAHRIYCKDNGVRFFLVAPWTVHPEDVLAKLLSNNEGEIRVDKLFDDNIAPGTKTIRKDMCKHLEINEDELKSVFKSLRIWKNSDTIDRLTDHLNKEFEYCGFKQIDKASRSNPYVELVKKWSLNGITEFSKDFIFNECEREKLILDKSKEQDSYIDIGIRSFYRRAEHMEDETEKMLCLLKYFDGRFIKNESSWQDDIALKLEAFISREFKSGNQYRIHLDTHLSNAYLAGYYLDTKSGVEVYPLQKSYNGREFWIPKLESDTTYPDWIYHNILLKDDKSDVALTLSVTHDITEDVKQCLKVQQLDISKIIDCRIQDIESSRTVIDGSHARLLAENLVRIIKSRTIDERKGKLHIFGAAPAALMFFIGQVSRSFGSIVLYEYDFEGCRGFEYFKSMELPLIK
jgi:hypothetical protein